jgi:multicomponent Na+:H+ antiporter subunit E
MRAGLSRAAAVAAAWMLLTGGDPTSALVGLPAAAGASWVSLTLRPPDALRISWRGLALFLPYFIWESLRGASAVALLAVRGPASLDPVLCRIPAALPSRNARVLALCVCSLLPGSLGAELEGNDYMVHALTGPEDAVRAAMRDVERHVAAVFGCSLADAKA